MDTAIPRLARALSRRAKWISAALALAIVVLVAGQLVGDDDVENRYGLPDNADPTQVVATGEIGGAVQAVAVPQVDIGPPRVATEADPVYNARPAEIPLDVALSRTTDLADGEVVKIHVTPKAGSFVYGFTAFLCRGDVVIDSDAKALPTNFGNCAAEELSPNSDRLLEVAAPPPYNNADADFRVGVGTNSFETRDGRQATVTCGPSDPCQIVLKLQFPNGYGIRAFPVTFR